MVHREHALSLDGFMPVTSPLLGPNETLYEGDEAYLFVTPVVGGDQNIGVVYLTYSREDLTAGIQRAVTTTLQLSAAGVVLGLLLSLLSFRHISRPMNVMLEGVDALGRGDPDDAAMWGWNCAAMTFIYGVILSLLLIPMECCSIHISLERIKKRWCRHM